MDERAASVCGPQSKERRSSQRKSTGTTGAKPGSTSGTPDESGRGTGPKTNCPGPKTNCPGTESIRFDPTGGRCQANRKAAFTAGPRSGAASGFPGSPGNEKGPARHIPCKRSDIQGPSNRAPGPPIDIWSQAGSAPTGNDPGSTSRASTSTAGPPIESDHPQAEGSEDIGAHFDRR